MFKILSIKSKEIKKGFIILSIFTLLSQFLALIRENIFSKFVGAGVDLDLYTASFRITDIVFIASASLISTFVLIPILNEKIGTKEGEENKEFKEYIDKVFTTFSLYLVILISVFYVFTPEIVS
jgi:peptidoglycan biosynthesis protein MviN/MurJ (putative lipid II flippase)